MDPTRSTGRRDSLLNEKKMWVDFQILENPSPRSNCYSLEFYFLLLFYKGENQVRTKNPNDSSMEKAVCEN